MALQGLRRLTLSYDHRWSSLNPPRFDIIDDITVFKLLAFQKLRKRTR